MQSRATLRNTAYDCIENHHHMQTSKRMQRPTPVTMRDVAKLAQVSQSTVSRVLNGSSLPIPISAETQQRVQNAVSQLGYQPNLYAGSLRGQKTQLIAMMIADIANPFYHPMVRAVQDIAHANRYDVLVANSDHTHENELLFIESIMRRPVDGIIMVPYYLTNDEIDELINRTGVAVAALGKHVDHPEVDVVHLNDAQAIFDATHWLIEQRGHRRIGFIGVTRTQSVGARRQDAFVAALAASGLSMAPDYFAEGDWSVEGGKRCMHRLLQLPTPPTAVFACNDNMAIGAILAAQERNVRIPQDVAVIGFDDIDAASWIQPHLTTIAQHPAVLGAHMASAVFERISGQYSGPARRIVVTGQFIERQSA